MSNSKYIPWINPKSVGYWDVHQMRLTYMCHKKPKWIVRVMARLLLDIKWVDA